MPYKPLFRYAFSAELIPLQELAKDMKQYGILYNDSLGERSLVTKVSNEGLFEQALLIVKDAVAELHRHVDPCDRTNPYYDELFADTHPNTFFIKIDDDGNYMPHGLASHSTIPTPEGPLEPKPPRKDSGIWRIAGFLLHEYVDNHALESQGSVDDFIETIANGSSTYIETVRRNFNETQKKDCEQDAFSEHVKKAAKSYLKYKK
jgi:hypothetical protein